MTSNDNESLLSNSNFDALANIGASSKIRNQTRNARYNDFNNFSRYRNGADLTSNLDELSAIKSKDPSRKVSGASNGLESSVEELPSVIKPERPDT